MVHQHRGIFTIEISKNVSAIRSQGKNSWKINRDMAGAKTNKSE